MEKYKSIKNEIIGSVKKHKCERYNMNWRTNIELWKKLSGQFKGILMTYTRVVQRENGYNIR